MEIGAVYSGFCKPQSCQKQKDNYSTDMLMMDISQKISKKVEENDENSPLFA